MSHLDIAKKFKAKKKLGQNFLIDPDILSFIAKTASLNNNETVIEIGPGLGFVTELLAKNAGRVIGIEIDPLAIEHLKALKINNLEIIQKDVLEVDFSTLVSSPTKVVANIPYYITSPILVHLVGEVIDLTHSNRKLISEVFIMVQKEVAKRMIATQDSKNKEWGALSVLLRYWTSSEIIKTVSKESFWPVPKVDSAIVKLNILDEPRVKVLDPVCFQRVVRASFNFRRKTLKNSLFLSGFSVTIVKKALEEIGLNDKVRGESLSIEKLALLSDRLFVLQQDGFDRQCQQSS